MKISIVTISYNQGRFLERAIQSIIGQHYDDIEYIVVDSGSTDGSRSLLSNYRDQISQLILESDSGPADGLNKGFTRATGQIFGFVNSDDKLLPGALRYVNNFFNENHEVDVLMGSGVMMDENDKTLRHIVPSRITKYAFAYGAIEFIQQSLFFRAEKYREIGGFNINNRVSWDGELLLDFILANAHFARSSAELGAFRVYSDSITGMKDYIKKHDVEHSRLFNKAIGRNATSGDALVSSMLKAYKWISDPWYVTIRLMRKMVFAYVGSNS